MPGSEAIEYHWTKHGKSINSDRVIISNNVLIVTPQAKNDYGEFECKAFYSSSNASSCRITLTEMKDEDEGKEGEHWLVKKKII